MFMVMISLGIFEGFKEKPLAKLNSYPLLCESLKTLIKLVSESIFYEEVASKMLLADIDGIFSAGNGSFLDILLKTPWPSMV